MSLLIIGIVFGLLFALGFWSNPRHSRNDSVSVDTSFVTHEFIQKGCHNVNPMWWWGIYSHDRGESDICTRCGIRMDKEI